MRKHLFPETGRFYKANPHCHSTVSDGANTPAEMKAYYRSHGYQILALTDHELLVDHSDLDEPDFLMLPGYEYAFMEDKPYPYARTLELNLYPREPGNLTQVCFDAKYVIHGEKWRCETLPRHGGPFERRYTVECVQKVVDEARAHGFIVSVNHPAYSMETPAFFGRLKGLFAMEIHNQGSFYPTSEYNAQMYDQMLRLGHHIGALAADDNHRAFIYDDPVDRRPWGFTMVKAADLTQGAVIQAFERGDYYASQGPLIHDLWVEDGKVGIACDAVKTVVMHTKNRFFRCASAPAGEDLAGAVFDVPHDDYFWFEVIDGFGRRASTRGYFADEFANTQP